MHGEHIKLGAEVLHTVGEGIQAQRSEVKRQRKQRDQESPAVHSQGSVATTSATSDSK